MLFIISWDGSIQPSMFCRLEVRMLVADVLRNFDLEDVHVEGTERIADAVAKYDVDRFIQVSSYNADPNSPSEFFSTKVRNFTF